MLKQEMQELKGSLFVFGFLVTQYDIDFEFNENVLHHYRGLLSKYKNKLLF